MLDEVKLGDVSAINGASARAMAEWIVSRGGDRWYPADAGDFGRCESLLDHVPALRARLGEMAEANAYWAALVPEWPRLRMIADGAALSAAVRAIIKPIERLDPGCAVLPNASFRVGDVCFSAEEYLMAKAARGKQVPMKEDAGDKAVASAAYGVTADELRQFVERYERLAQEKAEIAGQQKEVMAEAKGRGYDTKVIKMIIALRKRAPDEVAEEQAVLDLYKSALGMD